MLAEQDSNLRESKAENSTKKRRSSQKSPDLHKTGGGETISASNNEMMNNSSHIIHNFKMECPDMAGQMVESYRTIEEKTHN